ncbi:MAG: toll/interleukin-1 receptor domain-containing protein [Nitrospira sp.]|nr:toll/interleukin-1 receptor domain-containing protein [Nitrospira sp.]
MRNTLLPLKIQERLNGMFARNLGFSGPQILDFFSRYDINIDSYPISGAPSRKQMFEDCLARFNRETQLKIISDLLEYDGPFKHGPPVSEDVDFLCKWLAEQSVLSVTTVTKSSGSISVTKPGIETMIHHADQEWDVFVSHASADKEEFARPLAKGLKDQKLRVWFDEFTLRVGDSLRRSIDKGLAHSRYGVVVISPDFLSKEWPQKELDGLMAREVDGRKVILPVWHNIDAKYLREYSPLLADRLATSSSKGLRQVIDELLEAMR